MEPADRAPCDQLISNGPDQPVFIQHGKYRAHGLQPAFDFILLEGRAEIAASHRVRGAVGPARLILEQVIGRQRRPQGAPGIPGRRLDPDVLECTLAQHLAVGHAIERDAAGHAEILHAGLRRQAPRHPKHDLLGHRLNRGGQVHLALADRALG